jgi:hypothetical protein
MKPRIVKRRREALLSLFQLNMLHHLFLYLELIHNGRVRLLASGSLIWLLLLSLQ